MSTKLLQFPILQIALNTVHDKLVSIRRLNRLTQHLVHHIPSNAQILDVGSGNGELAAMLMQLRPDITIKGMDVLVRPDTAIPIMPFDGHYIPFPKKSFDVVMLIDVLHHTMEPLILLQEARRVARSHVLVKDHLCEGVLANRTLRFMDWVGNRGHGVALPYNYLSKAEWMSLLNTAGLKIMAWNQNLRLYPWLFSALFDRQLHVIMDLRPSAIASSSIDSVVRS